jgi:serine/threonine protein phosphatase PrpC
MKGHRPQNEDKHDTIVNFDGTNKDWQNAAHVNYYAVYDGHGGKFVSKFLHEHMPQCFMDKRVEYPLKKTFVKQIYDYWQNTFKTEYLKNTINTGSTCLIVIHYKVDNCDYLNILNTGDSRAMICRNNLGISLTKDHKPDWPEEFARIKALGGEIVWDGYDFRISDLSVSRAFGDISAEPYVTCIPDIYKYKLTTEDKFMVLACDGLWDVFNVQDVANFILKNCYDMQTDTRINKHMNIAKRLAEMAITKGSNDNVTIVIVFFK